jgi:hypothetical protein
MKYLIEKLGLVMTDRGLVVFGITVFFVIILSSGFGYVRNEIGVALITSIGILIAVAKYLYEMNKDKQTDIISLISFFRKEVISQHGEFVDSVICEKNNSKHEFVAIEMATVSLEWLLKNAQQNAVAQKDYIFHNDKTTSNATRFANAMEEFAAKVNILNASQSTELEILRPTFVAFFEGLAMLITAQRQLGLGESMYKYSTELYIDWSQNIKRVDKEQEIERIRNSLKQTN